MYRYTKAKKLYNKIERIKRELEQATKWDLQFESQNDFAKTHYELALRELENMLVNIDMPQCKEWDEVRISKKAICKDLEFFRGKKWIITIDNPLELWAKIKVWDREVWIDYWDFTILDK